MYFMCDYVSDKLLQHVDWIANMCCKQAALTPLVTPLVNSECCSLHYLLGSSGHITLIECNLCNFI